MSIHEGPQVWAARLERRARGRVSRSTARAYGRWLYGLCGRPLAPTGPCDGDELYGMGPGDYPDLEFTPDPED
jgi:hypothetical protein